jgi:hypothetical protein
MNKSLSKPSGAGGSANGCDKPSTKGLSAIESFSRCARVLPRLYWWQQGEEGNGARKKVMMVVELMNLEEQVDLDFTVARRRARLGRLKSRLLRRQATGSTLLSPADLRRGVPASGAMYRGRRTVEVSRIVGSVGKHEHFDPNFMPLSKASSERWKRIDRAFRLGQELPPVSLLRLGGAYFVSDGNHRVSVNRFHGVEWIDAEVTEAMSVSTRAA